MHKKHIRIAAAMLVSLFVCLQSEAKQMVEASQDHAGRVVVRWTGEASLGFNVYRVGADGARVKVNEQLVAGDALFARKSKAGVARSFGLADLVEHGAFAQYYVEAIGLDGTRTMHGPITPSVARRVAADGFTTAPRFIQEEITSSGGIFVSPRGLGAPGTLAARGSAAQQWTLASQNALKLMVTSEGWYRVTKSAIVAAGIDPGVDPKSLSLYTSGIEQPLFVNDGGDKRFDANDSIEFYGLGTDTPATDARAYWLVRAKGGDQLTRSANAKAGAASARSTPYTYRRVERTVFFSALTNNGDRENFFGAIVSNWGASEALEVTGLDPQGGNATLRLVLQGGMEGTHQIALALNGTSLGVVTVEGMSRHASSISLPLAQLRDGANELTLLALGGDDDISVVESVELTYPRLLIADGDALKAVVSGGTPVPVTGFTSGSIRALDVTDPAQPQPLDVRVANANGLYTATAIAPGSGPRTLVFFGAPRTASPAQLVPARATALNDRKNGADLLIIAAPGLVEAAEPLAAKRTAEGLTTRVVDVLDVYNEFGYGERGPEALREFLRRTQQWKRAPRYVLLLGDASIDPRNYLGLGAFDLVPTRMIGTFFMKTASDDWFVDFDDDGIPQFAIGRLPARTAADAGIMIGKIVNRAPSGAWANTVAGIADPNDSEFDFAAAARSLNAIAGAGYEQKLLPANGNEAFEALVTSYVGHGSVELWVVGFGNAQAAALTNGTKLPIVAGMTCLNGYFHDLYTTSLAESLLLNPNGGAVAVWTSSTLTFPEPQLEMGTEFYRRLFAGARLGDAAAAAKAATSDVDVRKSWIVFGDPSMPLR